MIRKKLLPLLLALTLALSLLAPKPARAIDVTTGLLIGAGVTGGIFLISLVGSRLIYGDDPHFLVPGAAASLERERESRSRIKLAPHCRNFEGRATLFCW
jgi:hypothetical protein